MNPVPQAGSSRSSVWFVDGQCKRIDAGWLDREKRRHAAGVEHALEIVIGKRCQLVRVASGAKTAS
jgi:hypothetical protein